MKEHPLPVSMLEAKQLLDCVLAFEDNKSAHGLPKCFWDRHENIVLKLTNLIDHPDYRKNITTKKKPSHKKHP